MQKNPKEPLLGSGRKRSQISETPSNSRNESIDVNQRYVSQDGAKANQVSQNTEMFKGSKSVDIEAKNIDCQGTDCQFLKESKSCIPIQNLEEEIKYYEEKKITKAVDIYLDHCQKYAQQYLEQSVIKIDDYQFLREDLEDRVISNKLMEILRLQEADQGASQITATDFTEMFKTESLKLFTDIIYYKSKHILCVKTWQKVTFSCKLKNSSNPVSLQRLIENRIKMAVKKKSIILNRIADGYYEKEEIESFNEMVSSTEVIKFHIKTLQFYDELGNKMTPRPILVEQVFGEFGDFRLYDTSLIKNQQFVYYFKRIFNNEDYEQNPKIDKSALDDDDNSISSGESTLQLFRYDLEKNQESQVEFIYCDEYNIIELEGQIPNSQEELKMNKDDKKQTILENGELRKLSDEEQRIKELLNYFRDGRPTQYNINFSIPFGKDAKYEYETEDKFLNMQFLTFQEYIRRTNEYKPFMIMSIGEMITENLQMNYDNVDQKSPEEEDPFIILDTERPEFKEYYKENKQDDKNLNRQIQFINHIQDHDSSQQRITFIIQNQFSIIQIHYNLKDKEPIFKRPDDTPYPLAYPRQSSDNYQKIWNLNGGIQVQNASIISYNENDEKIETDQYFFVDSRNAIQILYPNYEHHVDRVKFTGLISEQADIKLKNSQQFKKIYYIDEHVQESMKYINVFQSIRLLKMTLDYPDFNPAHQLTFVKDYEQQILYIQEPASRVITKKTMKDHECEMCETSRDKVNDKENKIGHRSLNQLQYQKKNTLSNIMNQNQCSLVKKLNIYGKDAMSKKEKAELDCSICGNDHDFQYISYFQQEQINYDGVIREEPIEVRLEEHEIPNHVFVDDFQGNKVKLRTYTMGQHLKNQQLRLLFYQPAYDYSVFIFLVFNTVVLEKGGIEISINDNKITRMSYIFVRKTRYDMQTLFHSQGLIDVIKPEDEVLLLVSNNCLKTIRFINIRDFQFRTIDSPDNGKNTNQNNGEIDEYRQIRISCSKISDEMSNINFIPFIYQESQNIQNNRFMIFDILKNYTSIQKGNGQMLNQMQMAYSISNNPNIKSQQYLYEDEQQFNVFALCRTSDVYQEKTKNTKKGEQQLFKQRIKYQMYTYYTEKLGYFEIYDILITYDINKITVQTVGMKNIFLSKTIIHKYDWQFISSSQTVPFYDKCGSIKGSQLLLHLNKLDFVYINLLDQDLNNIHKYQSDVVLTGSKKFQINNEDVNQFVVVISTVLRKKFIEMEIFDQSEAYKILRNIQMIQLGMRTPDLEFIALNDFEKIKRDDFFRAQELLLGKSIMDICLSDPQAIRTALQTIDKDYSNYNEFFKSHQQQKLPGSTIEMICTGDPTRRETFIEIGFFPSIRLIQFDFNFRSSIERAFQVNSVKALVTIMEYFFAKVNTLEYYPLIMTDLANLLDNKQVEINEFFQISQQEKKQENLESRCKIEMFFNKDINLPPFSNNQFETLVINKFKDFHQYEEEMAVIINERDQAKGSGQKNYETTHKYIDFSYTIIGEKIKNMQALAKGQTSRIANLPNDLAKASNQRFDDVYYSGYMLKAANGDIFYLSESVQRIIDFQWQKTQIFMFRLFLMYFFVYLLPLCTTLFTGKEGDDAMLLISVPAAYIIFAINCVHLKTKGPAKYFKSGGVTDFIQFFAFNGLCIVKFTGMEEGVIFIPELKVLIMTTGFIKLLFFIRIFENYGFLVQMIFYCVSDLIPFMIAWITFLIIFSICFVVLKMEIDEEVEDNAQGMNYFGKTLLQTYRTSLVELGMPRYTKIANEPDSTVKSMNIFFIWFMWFLQTVYMIVIMLNFIVGVIVSTYERVWTLKNIIKFKHRALMNNDAAVVISKLSKGFISCFAWFGLWELEEYTHVIISTSKEATRLDDGDYEAAGEKIKLNMQKQTKDISAIHDELYETMNEIEKQQKELEDMAQDQFKSLGEQADSIFQDFKKQYS